MGMGVKIIDDEIEIQYYTQNTDLFKNNMVEKVGEQKLAEMKGEKDE